VGEGEPRIPAGELGAALWLQSAPELIADRIVGAVAVGVLVVGDRLPPERELAGSLGVARNTLRQALARPAALGVIEVRRGRSGGTFVRALPDPALAKEAVLRTLEPARRDLELLIDLRGLIEELIARVAAERRDEADQVALRETASLYDAAASAEASRRADHALHHTIARATRNRYLEDLAVRIRTAATIGFSTVDAVVGQYRSPLHRASRSCLGRYWT